MILDLFKLFLIRISLFFRIININEYNINLVNFIKKNGTLFIKFGQFISSAAGPKIRNILGNDLINKLEALQDNCYSNVITIPYINYIEKEPIASGSISQVYKIYYKDKICVLKLIIPSINGSIEKSFKKLKNYKKIIYYFNYKLYKIINIFDLEEYYEYLILQLNLISEVNNLNKFKEIYKLTNKIIIPEVYYFDKNKIIMSFEEGIKIDDLEKNYNTYYEEALFLIISFIYTSVNNNILHADFHKGNYLFKIENNILKIIILDFGIVVPVENNFKKLFISLFDFTLTDKERVKISNEILLLNNHTYDIDEKIDFFNLETNKTDFIDLFRDQSNKISFKNITFGLIFPNITVLLQKIKKQTFFIKLMNYMYKNKILT